MSSYLLSLEGHTLLPACSLNTRTTPAAAQHTCDVMRTIKLEYARVLTGPMDKQFKDSRMCVPTPSSWLLTQCLHSMHAALLTAQSLMHVSSSAYSGVSMLEQNKKVKTYKKSIHKSIR